jgi:hypothetical protein
MDELLALPVSFSIDVASRASGMGRTKGSELYAKNDADNPDPCKVLKLGRELRVTKAELMRSLGLNLDGTPIDSASLTALSV